MTIKLSKAARLSTRAAWILGLVGLGSGLVEAQTTAAGITPIYQPYSNKYMPFPDDLKNKIKYVIIVFPENRSFDSLYGSFPGANGIANARSGNATQVDLSGTPFSTIQGPNTNGQRQSQTVTLLNAAGTVTAFKANGGYTLDSRFPAAIPNSPYDASPYAPVDSFTGDMVHNFYTEQYQINDKTNTFQVITADLVSGKSTGGLPMAKFSLFTTNPGLTISRFDAQNLGEGQLAKSFTLCDNAFHSAFGGSFLNHQFLISARAPVYQNPTGAGYTGAKVTWDGTGNFPAFLGSQHGGLQYNAVADAALSNDPKLPPFNLSNANTALAAGDYWAINTILPISGPAGAGYQSSYTDANAPVNNMSATSTLLPLQTHDTIGDRLSAANVTWAWYSEGWDDAVAGKANYLFQYHHQPYAYFAKYALSTPPSTFGTAGTQSATSAAHLKDVDSKFYTALNNGTLEQVTWVKPIGNDNSHPGYASVATGQAWVANFVAKVQASPIWNQCAIFIMYDEHGGLFDHVIPPHVDSWGPGLRVPLIVVSPFAKRGYVDHTFYDTTSLLAFIEGRFGVPALNTRDLTANVPLNAFTYAQGNSSLPAPQMIVSGVKTGKAFTSSSPAFNPLDMSVPLASSNPITQAIRGGVGDTALTTILASPSTMISVNGSNPNAPLHLTYNVNPNLGLTPDSNGQLIGTVKLNGSFGIILNVSYNGQGSQSDYNGSFFIQTGS